MNHRFFGVRRPAAASEQHSAAIPEQSAPARRRFRLLPPIPRALAALALLAVMLPLAASCQCAGDKSSGSPGASTGAGTGTGAGAQEAKATLSERSFKLPSGLAVDLINGPCGDTPAVAVLFNMGVDHDPPGRSGLAQLAGRVLATTGAQGRAPRTTYVGSDFTLYTVAAAPDALEAEIAEVAAWMGQGAPTEADLVRERDRMMEDLGKLTGADAPLTAVSLAEEAVRPTRGNGKRLGIVAEIKAITLAELQAYWQNQFKAGNARIAVAGPFDVEKVRAKIEAAFAAIPAGTPPTLRDPGDSTVKGTLVMGDAPKAVAIAVPVPGPSEPVYGAFLVLAARLLEKPAEPRTWAVTYDPVQRPDLLLVTGPVSSTEQAEPAAGRMRTEVASVLASPLAPGEVELARKRFQLFLEPKLLDADVCAKDARAFAVARTRAGQLGTKETTLAADAITKEQLDEAAKLFESKQSAAVIAGGALR